MGKGPTTRKVNVREDPCGHSHGCFRGRFVFFFSYILRALCLSDLAIASPYRTPKPRNPTKVHVKVRKMPFWTSQKNGPKRQSNGVVRNDSSCGLGGSGMASAIIGYPAVLTAKDDSNVSRCQLSQVVPK